MKLVFAVIQPTKLEAVRDALQRVGVERMTIADAQGYARQKGRSAMYRGHEYRTNLLRKIAIEVVVNDDFLDRTVDIITNVARTGPEGTIGDGKIMILPVEQAIDFSGHRGPEAV